MWHGMAKPGPGACCSRVGGPVCWLSALLLLGSCVGQIGVEGADCDQSHPCPEGFLCVEGICYREAPLVGVACTVNEDCPAGVCLREARLCVGCIQHQDCISGLCQIRTHICIGCKGDYQCPSGLCDEELGICEESSTDGEFSGK